MQTVSTLFNTIYSGAHTNEVKVVIDDGSTNGITVGQDKLVEVKTTGALFAENTLSYGGCCAKQLDLSFYPGSITVPRMAKLQVYMRIKNATQTSEWISKGVYYVDTRSTDSNGLMRITAYDAMLKTEQLFVPTTTPQSMENTAQQIAAAIGITLDSRCSFESYSIQLVTGYSMREILGFIAAAHTGNWVITDAGELRLIRASSTVHTFTLGQSKILSYEKGRTFDSISKVIIHIDGNSAKEAGSTTGRTLEAVCPWATDEMAQAVLAEADDVVYTPCTMSALLHPAAEIGDIVVFNSVSHIIANITINQNALYISEIETPGEEEIDHEYPYEAPRDRETERKLATVTAECADLLVTTAGISTRVTSVEGAVSTLSQTVSGFDTRISNAEGAVSTLSQTVDSLSASVSDKADASGGATNTFGWSLTSSGFYLYSNGSAVLSATSSGISITGGITADSGSIGGWTIDSDKIYKAQDSGQDGIGMFCGSGASRPSLWRNGNSKVVFYAGAGDDNPYPDRTGDCYFGVLQDGSVYMQACKISGGVFAGELDAATGTFEGTLSAGCLIGSNGYTSFFDDSDATYGAGTFWGYRDVGIDKVGITLYNNTDAWYAVMFAQSAIAIESPGNISIANTTVQTGASIAVGSTEGRLKGTWKLSSGAVITSDRNKKNTISPIGDRYGAFFDLLTPVTFKLNDGTSDRLHSGFIAQDVKSALDGAQIDSSDFAGYVGFDRGTPEETFGLRYEEFVALNTWQIQKLKARVAELEERINANNAS